MSVVRNRFSLAAAAAVGAGAVLAFALPAGAAVSLQSQSPPVDALKLGARATLDANGAVVFPSVQVLCQSGRTAFLTVRVTENVGNAIASGSGGAEVACNGQQQTLRIAVTPTQKPFKTGIAFGQAFMTTCTSFTCHELNDQHNIRIVKKD